MKTAARKARAEAEATCDLNDEVREAFEKLPDTFGGVQTALDERQAKLRNMVGDDPRVLQEYEDRQVQIDSLRRELDSALAEHEVSVGRLRVDSHSYT